MGKEDQESKKASSEAKEELEILIPVPKIITALDGTEVEVPKTTWKDEIKIGRLVSEGLSKISELKEIDFKNIEIKKIFSLLPTVIDVAPDTITSIASILLKKDKEWIENNLDGEIIMGLLGPFFRNFFKKVLGRADLPSLIKLTEKVPLPKS